MPLTEFIHDGHRHDIKECLEQGLLAHRYPRSYLEACASQRDWTGVPSVTQCISGTREAFLKLTTDWAVDPDDSAWLVLGTRGHSRMELAAKDAELESEFKLTLSDFTGISDLLEPYDGYYRLVDYKVIGSYRVGMLAYGIPGKKERAAASEEEITAARLDAWMDYGLQLNMYRIMTQKLYPEYELHPTQPVWLFGIARDGGTWMAKNRGVTSNTFLLPAPLWPDDKVLDYFARKRTALLDAMGNKEVPSMCNDHETWNGRKCASYCPVAQACREAG